MDVIRTLAPIVLYLSLAGLVLSVGMHSTRGDLVSVLRNPKQLSIAILAVIVIPPVAAGLLVSMLPLDPVVKAGIMLMAISPVPPLVPGRQLGLGAHKSYAYGLYVSMALLTVISVPIVLAITTALFGRNDSISVGKIASTLMFGVLAPLCVGLLLREFAPKFAERFWRTVYKISLALVLIVFVPLVVKAWPAIVDLVGNGTLAAMASVTLIAIAAGHLLGGPDLRDRATLAMASSVRHPGIATAIAGASFQDDRITAAIILFLLVGTVASIPYSMWIKRHGEPPSRSAHA